MAREYKDYPSIALSEEEFGGQMDFVGIFGRSGRVEVEIGCGKGTFLVSQGRAQPECDFLGVEWARKYYRHAVDRVGRWGLTNVRLVRTDAGHLLANCIADGSVDCFHIYFPDPWPKKRHHKRRLLSAVNVEHLIRCLNRGGRLQIATDHAEYFEQIEAVLAGFEGELEQIEFVRTAGAEESERVGTNYERKYVKENRSIRTIALRKT